MFDEIETKILTRSEPEDLHLKQLMQKSILHIAKIIQPPSVTSLATHTRLIVSETHNELKKWIESNKERFQNQRRIFHEFLNRIQSLQNRVSQLAQ